LVEDKSRLAETVRRGLAAKGFVVDVEHDGVDGWAAAETRGIPTWWSLTSCCRG
jgi:two-component system OmpR family response regulator